MSLICYCCSPFLFQSYIPQAPAFPSALSPHRQVLRPPTFSPLFSLAPTRPRHQAGPRQSLTTPHSTLARVFRSVRHSSVEITAPALNTRRVRSAVDIRADPSVVWDALSDYGRLTEYIPNLAVSRVLVGTGRNGGVLLEQCGVQSVLGFEFKASVVMEMTERGGEGDSCRFIEFELVESSDFKEFYGRWDVEDCGKDLTRLRYCVTITPRGLVPVKAIEWRIGEDVPQNMNALKRHCEILNRRRIMQETGE